MPRSNSPDAPSSVVIIGLDGGIGAALTEELLNQGYAVSGTVRPWSGASEQAVSDRLGRVLEANLTDSHALERAVTQLVQEAGDRLAGVIVCAGVAPSGALDLIAPEALRAALEINTVANLVIYQASIATLRSTRGRLIMIGSYAGGVGLPGLGPYVASKHALEGMCDVMRREAAGWGVHVILFRPGGVRTGMIDQTLAEISRRRDALSEDARRLTGPLYDGLFGLASEGAHRGVSPQTVAMRIVGALRAHRPKARYVVGMDAAAFLWLRHWLSDGLMDRLLRRLYAAKAITSRPNAHLTQESIP